MKSEKIFNLLYQWKSFSNSSLASKINFLFYAVIPIFPNFKIDFNQKNWYWKNEKLILAQLTNFRLIFINFSVLFLVLMIIFVFEDKFLPQFFDFSNDHFRLSIKSVRESIEKSIFWTWLNSVLFHQITGIILPYFLLAKLRMSNNLVI